MKKVFKNLMLVVIMQAALSASGAKSGPQLEKVQSRVDHKIGLKTTKVVVKNKKGRIIQEVMVNLTSTLLEELDLSTLPDGFYSFELYKDSEINVTPFVVMSNQVILDQKKSYTIFKPFIRTNGSLVYLTRLSFEKKNLKVEIYDIDQNLIYSELIKKEVELERIYDFSELKDMKIKIELTTEDRTFVYKLEF